MKSKKALFQLIEQIEKFELENPNLESYELTDILNYLQGINLGQMDKSLPSGLVQEINLSGVQVHQNRANLISRQVSLMYRYAKEYMKKGLESSLLNTVEEFSFLIVLMAYDSLTKTELIHKNAMGKTSGIEVIKRLLKKQVIHQFADEYDKRSQRVAITEKGKDEMRKIFPKIQLASDVITGNLDVQEQQTLIYLLQKLNTHHKELFLNHLGKSLVEIRRVQKIAH